MAAEAQYVIGVIYESQTRFSESADAFLKMDKFKKHDKAPDALTNASLIREALRDYSGAVEALNKYLKAYPGQDNVADVNFRIGLLYERMGDKKNRMKAVKHYQKFASKYKDKYVMKVEAYARAGNILRDLDEQDTQDRIDKAKAKKRDITKIGKIFRNRKKASALFESAIAEYPLAGQQIMTLRGDVKIAKMVTARHYAAMSSYWLADYVFQDFDKAKIPGTLRVKILKAALIEKAELHQSAEQAFDKVLLGPKDAEFIACAAFRNGLLYYNFAKELFEVPIPFGLNPEQEDAYRAALEEMGAPIQEKSLILLEAALKAAHKKGVYNKCSKEAGIYASKVNPEGYPISDEPEVQPRHVKDTLLSANFVRTLKRGNIAVDMMKKTQKDVEAK